VVDPDEAELLSLISLEPQHIDDLVQQSEQPISQVSGLLTMLELKGLIQQVGSMHYQLTH
jgi:predicted Rossmann fold nucleotide-binding protein DprA/Smf involved in DNA uptake